MWKGCYKTMLNESESYLFLCSQYIELNPVCANMVSIDEVIGSKLIERV